MMNLVVFYLLTWFEKIICPRPHSGEIFLEVGVKHPADRAPSKPSHYTPNTGLGLPGLSDISRLLLIQQHLVVIN